MESYKVVLIYKISGIHFYVVFVKFMPDNMHGPMHHSEDVIFLVKSITYNLLSETFI